MNKKSVIVLMIIGAVGYYVFVYDRYHIDPILFAGDSYVHVETSEVINIPSYFLTREGVELEEVDKYFQIAHLTPGGYDERQILSMRKRLFGTLDLSPFHGQENRFFGMFRDRYPIYAVHRDGMFIIFVHRRGFGPDPVILRVEAGDILDKLERLAISF